MTPSRGKGLNCKSVNKAFVLIPFTDTDSSQFAIVRAQAELEALMTDSNALLSYLRHVCRPSMTQTSLTQILLMSAGQFSALINVHKTFFSLK